MTIESRWPLYPSFSNIEQERSDDQDRAQNLGNLVLGFPATISDRSFCGATLESFPESLTSGLVVCLNSFFRACLLDR